MLSVELFNGKIMCHAVAKRLTFLTIIGRDLCNSGARSKQASGKEMEANNLAENSHTATAQEADEDRSRTATSNSLS